MKEGINCESVLFVKMAKMHYYCRRLMRFTCIRMGNPVPWAVADGKLSRIFALLSALDDFDMDYGHSLLCCAGIRVENCREHQKKSLFFHRKRKTAETDRGIVRGGHQFFLYHEHCVLAP